jgi:hypothetical protein
VNPTKLRPNPENPNRHSAHQIQILAAVIQEQGWRAPITVSKRSGLIVRGHGRLEAAMLMGCDVVPVDEQDYKSEAEELADLLADNRLSELAELDEDDLRRVIERLRGADPEFDVELAREPPGHADMVRMHVRGDDPLGFARAEVIVQQALPGCKRLCVLHAGINQRPAIAVTQSPQVDVLQRERQRHANPHHTGSHLKAMAISRCFEGIDERSPRS